MPYICEEDRTLLACMEFDFDGIGEALRDGGELNYVVSSICAAYIEEHGLRYANISDVVGALEGAKQEFFRQIVNPYEQNKLLENGSIPAYNRIRNEMNLKD